MPQHSLPQFPPSTLRYARFWLWIGVVALGLAGIFAGLLANSKSNFFYPALVIHVDLSVLVWFLTFACMLFTLASKSGSSLLVKASLGCFALGTILFPLAVFTQAPAYMSNYIPVIHHPVFFLGLSFLLCGVLGSVTHLMLRRADSDADMQTLGILSAGLILLIALACFFLSFHQMPDGLSGQAYYEYVFWGGGHLLQFVHTQLLLVAWIWLARSAGLSLKLNRKLLYALYGIGVAVSFAGLSIYAAHAPSSYEHREAFTWLMRYGNGLAPTILAFIILFSWERRSPPSNVLARMMLVMSMVVFFVGGVVGYMISGSNVVVPAHYHGSIVGITLAFMGIAYLLLPQFGYRDVSQNKWARWQPIIYGGGQLCWMAGMISLGIHGVPRKTPGSADTMGTVASLLKHGGDGLALIGGLLFVFIVIRAAWKRHV